MSPLRQCSLMADSSRTPSFDATRQASSGARISRVQNLAGVRPLSRVWIGPGGSPVPMHPLIEVRSRTGVPIVKVARSLGLRCRAWSRTS